MTIILVSFQKVKFFQKKNIEFLFQISIVSETTENPDEINDESSMHHLTQNEPDEHLKHTDRDHLSNLNHQHQDTMNIFVQEEMKYRVKESKYRSELQLAQLEKARAELIHMRTLHQLELSHKREMNRLELQSAKIRYENLMKQ